MPLSSANRRCPVCGVEIRPQPSSPIVPQDCPQCGTQLWQVAVGDQCWFTRRPMDDRWAEALIRKWNGADDPVGADSLDVVELVMLLEEESSD